MKDLEKNIGISPKTDPVMEERPRMAIETGHIQPKMLGRVDQFSPELGGSGGGNDKEDTRGKNVHELHPGVPKQIKALREEGVPLDKIKVDLETGKVTVKPEDE